PTYRTVSIDQVRSGVTSMRCRLMAGLSGRAAPATVRGVVAPQGMRKARRGGRGAGAGGRVGPSSPAGGQRGGVGGAAARGLVQKRVRDGLESESRSWWIRVEMLFDLQGSPVRQQGPRSSGWMVLASAVSRCVRSAHGSKSGRRERDSVSEKDRPHVDVGPA